MRHGSSPRIPAPVGNPKRGDPIPGSTRRHDLPWQLLLGSLRSGMWCPYSGKYLLEHGTGELCQDSPFSMPQVQQDPPDPSGSSRSSTASVLQLQLHAPSSRPCWPGMALCLESQLQ